jgi:sugar/nucleoside kinase (ribokinase family)
MSQAGVLLVGLCTVDVVQRVAELPSPGQKLQSTSVELVAGGPSANAAITVAAMGGRSTLVTVLGVHPLGALARADLTGHGVRIVDTSPVSARPPAVSSVAVRERDGERIVVSHNAVDIDPTDLPAWPALLADVGAVLVDGHHPKLAVAAARAARGRRIPVVLDAGSDKPVLSELLPLVDVCACAATFRLGPRHGPRATERAVHDLGVPVVLRTDGAGPVRWSVLADGHTTTGQVRPPAVVPRDTLGAGDVWHGALALGVAGLGRVPTAADLSGLVEVANRVAATRVGVVGARAWLRQIR